MSLNEETVISSVGPASNSYGKAKTGRVGNIILIWPAECPACNGNHINEDLMHW